MKNFEEKDEILINIMYTGDYTNKNIGHEIINLYKTDVWTDKKSGKQKGSENYLYISPYGLISQKHTSIKYVILARPAGKEKLEILAKAEVTYPEQDGQKLAFSPNVSIKRPKQGKDEPDKDYQKKLKIWKEQRVDLHKKHIKFIEDNKIKYGNKFLNEIFEKNERDETTPYITFKVNKLYKPNKKIYIIDKRENNGVCFKKKPSVNKDCITFTTNNIGFRNTSCIKYLNENDNKDVYNTFMGSIINANFWEKCNTPSLDINSVKIKNLTFIEIMGKQNDELAYSNMLAYFLSNPSIFKCFAKDILLVNGVKADKTFEIKREEDNIDILIITDKHVFIIENKIKSGINGIKYDHYNDTYTNQLCTYYKKIKEKYNKDKEIHCYILHPNYNDINLERIKGNYTSNNEDAEIIDKYKPVTYKEIFDFFEKQQAKIEEKDLFKQFKEALKLHVSNNDNIIQKDMEYKFRQAIKQAKT